MATKNEKGGNQAAKAAEVEAPATPDPQLAELQARLEAAEKLLLEQGRDLAKAKADIEERDRYLEEAAEQVAEADRLKKQLDDARNTARRKLTFEPKAEDPEEDRELAVAALKRLGYSEEALAARFEDLNRKQITELASTQRAYPAGIMFEQIATPILLGTTLEEYRLSAAAKAARKKSDS